MDLIQNEKIQKQKFLFEGDLGIALFTLNDYVANMSEEEFNAFLAEQRVLNDGFTEDFTLFIESQAYKNESLLFDMEVLFIEIDRALSTEE